ncbi:MAG: hypothetical protein CVU39_07940 [Chloroflexi bacterium HGW-Chloroflexi-10]|nr:MAG: hypothetical protein CVU39_07940 [Chloroflexi bacterium HGW-Chloroflexi-10]
MKSQELVILVHYDDEITRDYVSTEISKYGLVQAVPDKNLRVLVDPVLIAVIVGSVFAAAHFVMSIIERIRGGMVLDLTGDKPEIRSDRDIPLGWLIIIAKDGKVELKKEELPAGGLQQVIEKLFAMGTDITKAAIEAAVKSVKTGEEKKEPAEGQD